MSDSAVAKSGEEESRKSLGCSRGMLSDCC